MAATILFLVAALFQLSAAKIVYKYEAQAAIGIPESGRDVNIVRIEFNVAATRLPGTSDFILKIDPTSAKAHNFTGPLFPMPEGVVPIDGRLTALLGNAGSRANLAAQLAKPIIVSRNENGTLSNIRHDTSDPYWSLNLKRGALSLLQLNIQTDEGVYTVQEEDVTGSCPSTYLVQSREHYHGHDHAAPSFLNVTKSRDYSNCKNRTILRHSFFSGIGLSDEEFAQKNIISNAKFAYNISGTKAAGSPLLVESAYSEAQHIFTVFKPLSGSLSVVTHQRITLLSVDSDGAAVPAVAMTSNSFAMALPNVVTADSEWKFNDDQVVSEVRDAVGILSNPNTPDHLKGLLLNRIVERMRGASLSAWETIGQGALRTSPEHLKLLLDLAPSTGTLESLQKLQSVLDRVTPNITSQYFAISSFLAEPTFKMITTMKTICESSQVRETLRETKSCILSLASMIHNRYIRSNYYLQNATFSAEEKAAVVDFIATVDNAYNFAFSTNLSMQLLWVKVAGNMGWPRLLNKLKGVAKNESNPIVLRVHAIRAFRRYPAAFNGDIQNFLLPIFTDWHNDVEVRLAAYRAIIASSPSQGILDLISAALHHEHDEHVRTYVYSNLRVLTRNPLVSEVDLSDKARVTLQGLSSIIPNGLQYSRYYRLIDTYDDERNAGFTLDLSVVGTTRSLLPREFCLWARGVTFGVKSNMAHLCLRLQGIQRLMQRLLRTGGPVFPDFFSQLNLNQIEYEEFHGLWDASFEGSEIQYQEIPPFLTQAMSDPQAMQQRLVSLVTTLRTPIRKTIVLDSTLQVPSLLGIPVQSNNTYVLLLNMSLGSFGIVPACRFNPRQPCQVNLRPYGVYRLGSQHSLGVNVGPVQSSVLLHGLVSRDRIDARNWTISWSKYKQNLTVSFEAELPKTRTITAHTEVIPFLVTVDRTQPLASQFNLRELNQWHESAVAPINFNFELNTTAKLVGFTMGFNKTYSKCLGFYLLPATKPTEPFCGRVTRDFYVAPQSNAPDKVRVTFKHAGPATTELQSDATFRSDDSFDATNDEDVEHNMISDLSKLSSRLSAQLQDIEEMREHLNEEHDDFQVEEDNEAELNNEAEFEAAVEAELNSEAEAESVAEDDDDEVEHFLVRRRRAARSDKSRKDRKPGVGHDKKRKPTEDSEPPTKEQITGKGTSNTIEVVGFRNGAESRKILLTVNRTPGTQPKQFLRNFNLKATIEGQSVMTACGKATVQYPTTYVSLVEDMGEPSFSYNSKVEFGRDRCESDKAIELRFNLSRSTEQKLATSAFLSNSPAAKKWYIISVCQKDLAKGYVYTWPCRHLFNQMNEAHRMELTIKASDSKKMSVGDTDLRNWISMLLLRLRVKYWQNLKSSFVRDVKEHSKEISVVGERNLQLPHLANIKVSTPETTSQFQNLYLRHNPISLYLPMAITSLYHFSGYRLPGICVAHRKARNMYVTTFDNVVYNVTPPSCSEDTELNVLLAADCSSASKFAVSLNYNTGTRQFEVRVATAAHTAVFRPNNKAAMPNLYVDNVLVVDEKYEVKAADGSSGVTAKIGFGSVSVMFDVGVKVSFMQDNAIMIGASPLYSGVTCGLCGDYNGQALDEYALADGTLTNDSGEFYRSFVAGAQQCSA